MGTIFSDEDLAVAAHDVRDFGAKGDGMTKDTAAIQRAIDKCGESGGGRVVLANGTFLSGAIQLRTGVELHIDGTARFLASPDIADFPEWKDVRHVDSASLPRGRNACFIFADEVERISITGDGVIDCNGQHHVKEKTDPNWTGLRYERKYPLEKTLPRVVFFAGCRDVRLRDVTLTNSPGGWGYWLHDCDRVQVTGLKILVNVEYPNNDGLHINCCRDVTVSDCIIESGDDAIIVRANSRSLAVNKPCERVVVANCTVRSWANGIRLGWVNDGVIRNCSFSNIAMHDTSTGICIMLPEIPNNPDFGREATLIENVTFDGIQMDGIYAHPLRAVISPSKTTLVNDVRDIRFCNVHAKSLEHPLVSGRPGNPFRRFVFSNCSFRKVTDAELPGWSRHGPAVWERVRQTTFENAEGFVFNNTSFDATTNAVDSPTEPLSRMESRTADKTREPGLFGDYWWANRFLSRRCLIEAAKGQTVDVVLLGDSMIHFWEWRHPASWAKFREGRTALNLGYGGDKTENVIWRIEHGELDGYTAKCVVLVVGTNNNMSNDSDPAAVAKGVEKIVALIRARQPQAKIVLHPIFPRGRSAASSHAGARARNDKTNALLKEFADRDGKIVWIDFNDSLVDEQGWVPESIMADEIHPTDVGYDIWMKNLSPHIP